MADKSRSGGAAPRAGWRHRLYRLGIAWRGPACWHWRYYGWDYRAARESHGWRILALGRERHYADLSAWQPAGGTVHIVLSGPSLASLSEPARLGQAPTLAVNGSYRVLANAGLRADLYLVSDVGYVRRQWDAFVEGVRNARVLAVDHRVLLEVLRRDATVLESVEVRVFDLLSRPYARSAHWWRELPQPSVSASGREACFSMNSHFGFHPSCTVAYLALQIAAAQSPRRVVMFGLDLRGGSRYYAEPQAEKSMLDQDYERCIEPHFRLASQVLRHAGIEVINASEHSRLPDDIFVRRAPDAALTPGT